MPKRASSRRLPAARPPHRFGRTKGNPSTAKATGGVRTTFEYDVAVFVYQRGGRRSTGSVYDLIVSKASGPGSGRTLGKLEVTAGKRAAIKIARSLAKTYTAEGHRRVDVQDEANSLGTYYAQGAARDDL